MTASNIETAFPLTPLQEGMLYHALRNPDSAGYWGQCEAELHGPMDEALFRAAWDRIAERHQAFRTFFAWEGRERPLQVVRKEVQLSWDVFDWSSETQEEQEDRWRALVSEDWANPRGLDVAPVMRFVLVRLASGRHKLLWSLHHMLADGWSGNLVLKEVLETYEALRSGSDVRWAAPPSFAKFVTWLASRDDVAAERYWQQQLSGLRAATPLPGGSAESSGGPKATAELRLSGEVTHAVEDACSRMRITPNTLALGSWALVLARHLENAEEVTLGVTVSERPPEIPGVARSVGLYLSTVPLRTPMDDGIVVTDWLSELQGALADAREHSAGGLADIRGWSEIAPGTDLVRSLVVYESFPREVDAAEAAGSLHLESLSISAPSDLPLALLVYPGSQRTLQLVYDSALYGSEDAMRLLRLTARALQQLTISDARSLGDIDLLDAAMRYDVLDVWSGAETPAPQARDVLELFEENVRLAPTAAAIREEGSVTTYEALDEAANRLAHEILESVGVDELVGIPSDAGADAIVAVVAALKAGRGYTFLDPRQPDRRLNRLLTHVQRVIVRREGTRWGDKSLVWDGGSGEPSTKPDPGLDPASVAYVVWTSGSTGEPKGVVIERRHLARSTAARLAYYTGEPGVNLLMSSLAVDSSVAGLFGTLCSGGCLVLPPHRIEQDLDALVGLMESASVTTTLMLPSLYRALLEEADTERLASLQRVVVAGEACPPSVVALHRRRLPSVELHNEYGPSEGTVWATVSDLVAEGSPKVTIGRPVPGVRVYVLDARGRPVPAGTAGEICIGGGTVARGYLDAPDLTAERFVPDPFASGGRMYRTGDRGRFLSDGRLEFLGRIDDQFKVRGYRVEPVEVERAIEAHPGVSEAAVALSSPPGSRLLVAYVAPAAAARRVEDLRDFVRQRLPAHMVPSRFVQVERLPRTSAGKLDRRSLADLDLDGADPASVQSPSAAPRTSTEIALAEIWKDVLGVAEVDVHADFFEMGGDSLLSIRVLSRASRAGISISPEEFFAGPTISRLASLRGGGSATAEQGIVSGGAAPAPIQEWFFETITEGRDHWNQSFLFEVPPEVEGEMLGRVMRALSHHHDATRLRFYCEEGGWQQQLEPEPEVVPVRVVDLAGAPMAERATRMAAAANAEHRSLDVTAGSLFRSVLFVGEGDFRRLLLVAHHLIVDGISWGILLEDLSTLVDQAVKGAPFQLPPKTASVLAWSEALQRSTAELDGASAVEHWREVATPSMAGPEVPSGSNSSTVADATTATLVLEREETVALMEGATRGLDASVEELLLGAFLSVWMDQTPSHVLVDIEGHGRDAVKNLDVSRTVGWFTTVTPLALSLREGGAEAAVRAVRTALAGLPGGRGAYGLLRYLHPDPAVRSAMKSLPQSGLLFNYLSTVDDVLPAGSPFRRAEESSGSARSPDAPRAYPVEVNAMVLGGRLAVKVEYTRNDYGAHEMKDLLDALRRALLELADGPATASGDFELAELDEVGMSRVADLLAEIDGG